MARAGLGGARLVQARARFGPWRFPPSCQAVMFRPGAWIATMGTEHEPPRVVGASREIAAAPGQIFELIADPAQQPRWDGNDNLRAARAGQRVHRAGDVFTMTLTTGAVRENHVVEFEEGSRIAWTPAEPGRRPPGHLWRWELERRRIPHPGHLHLRLDPADRQEPPPARPVNHGRKAPGLPRPARRPRERNVSAFRDRTCQTAYTAGSIQRQTRKAATKPGVPAKDRRSPVPGGSS